MSKVIIVIICAIALIGLGIGIHNCILNSANSKTAIEKDAAKARIKKDRSVTVINNTNSKYIKESSLLTDKGVLIDHKDLIKNENIVFKNFDKNNAYEDEKKFKIILIDRYGLKYERVFESNAESNTDVVVTENDYVKQKGDSKRKLERAINE